LVEADGGQQGQEEERPGAARPETLAGGQVQDAGVGVVGQVGLGGRSAGRPGLSATALRVEKGGGVPAAQS
jgi:hypothetical protein